jgi:glycosyltransferase involved in cell wall biosynthesis
MTADKPIITVITAVFNGQDYIEETVYSVLGAARNIEFEYIVVNDGSTDGTSDILLKFENQIRVINKPNTGESESVTIGFGEARGDYLIVVSADDPLFTEKLFEKSIEEFKLEKNLVAIYPDWRMIGPIGEILQEIRVPDYSDELMIGRCITLPGPGVIIRKSAALEIGGRRKKWTFVGDYDFWLRLSRIGELRHRPEILAQWRYHPGSTSVNKRGPKMARERIAVIEEFLAENTIDEKIARMALGSAYFMAARLVFFNSEVPGKKYLLASFQKRKGWVEEAKIHILLYILLTPVSSFIYRLVSRFLPTFRTLK